MQAFVEFSEAAGCKKEEADKDLPFTPDAKKAKPSTAGKYGSAYSTVRNLARQAMQKQTTKKAVKEEGGKVCVDEETLIEKLDKKQELRAALDRHTQKAIEANRRGDDEAVKTHQSYINKIKDKMAKLVRSEEVELEEEQLDELNKGYAPGWMLKADPELAKKVKDKTQGYKDLKKYAGRDIPKKEEVQLEESSDAHKVMVTVSDPNHQAVSQRKEQIMKHVIVRAGDKGEAQAKAEAFYKKRGYKVHGSEYHSKQPATSMKTEEAQLDELNKSTLASYAKKSVAELPKHQANATLKHTGPIANAHSGKHPKTGESPVQWDDRKVKNRMAGVTRAIDKLTKEELNMKTFTQFMEEIKDLEESSVDVNEISEEQLDEYETKNGRYVHKGSYGSSYQPEDDEDEDEPKKKPAPTGEKRGRGRPKGSTSGARQQGSGKSKSYGGLAIHSLSLPNTRK